MEEISNEAANNLGSTQAPRAEDNVDNHFITFICIEGHLYEFDGAKKFPINHCPSSTDTFIQDAAKVIREKFFAKDVSFQNPFLHFSSFFLIHSKKSPKEDSRSLFWGRRRNDFLALEIWKIFKKAQISNLF